MKKYLKNNLLAGYRGSPLNNAKISLTLLALFPLIALPVGTFGNLFSFQLLDAQTACIAIFALFLFPALLEESFFRGLLVPIKTRENGKKAIFLFTLLSASLFTLWHPLNALTINPGAQALFCDPYFLCIVFCLGIACSLSYIFSRSLWVPIIIHWLTVVVWVIFLGGRNLLLQ
ncbi:MAG: CPBP family glutamic-type intramembrane protease [Candidatus Electrothrix aestuarii]|jgi:predicted Abi (CAAX) family protease|uniref:CPBP family glutamic-type intramembrane protease n=1 Tax=Candidatus Electrothrix aestuarii TaxID=3062594 RepID=A0AAU8LX52_9BACT